MREPIKLLIPTLAISCWPTLGSGCNTPLSLAVYYIANPNLDWEDKSYNGVQQKGTSSVVKIRQITEMELYVL